MRESVTYPLFFLLVLWLVYLWCYLFNIDMRNYALIPRTVDGLWGILFSPFLHANSQHLLSNSLPLLILSSTIIYFYRQVSAQTIFVDLSANEYFGLAICAPRIAYWRKRFGVWFFWVYTWHEFFSAQCKVYCTGIIGY